MLMIRRIWSMKRDERVREKLVELATEFCLEASVLISVLGILDSAIAAHGRPTALVFGLSLALGLVFFLMSCIIQAVWLSSLSSEKKDEPAKNVLEEVSNDSRDS